MFTIMPIKCKEFHVTSKVKRHKNACQICAKKVTLGEIYLCRCGLEKLCSKHRSPENHCCSFDYKSTFNLEKIAPAAKVEVI